MKKKTEWKKVPVNKDKKERIAHLEQMKQMNEVTIKKVEQNLENSKGMLEKIRISNELLDSELERLKVEDN